MSRIHLLTDDVSNKIAAGEVIERPASVVKELVENSLDAHARKISVRIERAGQRLIAVSDDGDGMDPDDALLCFEPHATSKIQSAEDILKISTFGFRGEAMPSIASVARVSLKTRRRDSLEGFSVSISGGVMGEAVPAGCAPGTEMSVRDLFYNVPARRKFLKSNATEERRIIEVVSVISLAHPDVAFELLSDARVILQTPAGNKLLPRIRDVFGREISDSMIELSYASGSIRVEGFIAKRGMTRPTRAEQKIFVNGRPVESLPVYRGIRDGCGPMLDKGRWQPAVLFLTMPPELVDVNVHPAKREVRFRNEYELTSCVREAVAEALRADAGKSNPFLVSPFAKPHPLQTPEEFLNASPSASGSPLPEELPEQTEGTAAGESGPSGGGGRNTPSPDFLRILEAAKVRYVPISRGVMPVRAAELFASAVENALPSAPDEPEGPKNTENRFPGADSLEILGILADTYIIAKMPDGLVLIDQHAAHERVLYEKILRGENGTVSQKLLIPLTLELSRSDCQFVSKNGALFEKVGFSAEPFGGETVKLEAIPAALTQDNAGGVFKDLLSLVRDEEAYSGGKLDSPAIARAACKAAVKAHDKLTFEECRTLIRLMSECELPYCCPHGRPTVINFSVKELERRFGRVR